MRELTRLFGKKAITRAEAHHLAAAFKAFADPTRLQILGQLAARVELTQSDLIAALPQSQPTVAHHLRKLVAAGLVSPRKSGVWVHYSANHRTLRLMSDAIRPGSAR